ncbi:MAG: DNA polymerase IV [Gordonia sp. (in: high G+C Gram-positive bacteria)]|uniref:DNA polymerase IV n=1 Tax=Gordonia sp. (in: high G+C Gram-positive bacteria) TaxID=84139 RepID=UPI0039E3422D
MGPGGAGGGEVSARWVLHLDMDAFFASVEQLTRPTLRGRPVLVGGRGGRGVVAGASYEARAFGARSAMPMHQARRLVGAGGVVVPPRGAVYRVASKRVFDVVRARIPVIEMLSFDEAFGEPAELAGAGVDDAVAFAEDLRAAIRERTGLTASVGLGSGKQIAKIASGGAKPDGVLAVEPSRELNYLHALPVRKLWGIGPVSGDKLARLGIETIGDFADLAPSEAASVLGPKIGHALHELARGIDERPVHERAEAKQISSETTLAVDIVALEALRAEIARAAADAHRRLLADGRMARTVVLKLRRADMSVLTRSVTLPAGTTDLDELTAAATRQVLDPLEIGPIRLVGVGYSGLTGAEQFTLFDNPDGGPPGPDPAEEDFDSAFDGAGVLVRAGEPTADPAATAVPADDGEPEFATGSDVHHEEFGHGWVQGTGHGVVTVRFETRVTGPGIARTFPLPEPALRAADPLVSLAWDED